MEYDRSIHQLRRQARVKHRWKIIWHRLKKPLRIAAGVGLLVVGIAGLIFPIMPGWIFIFPALGLLGPNTRLVRWMRSKLHNLRCRFSKKRHCQPRNFCGP
jgi:hypothetical protein